RHKEGAHDRDDPAQREGKLTRGIDAVTPADQPAGEVPSPRLSYPSKEVGQTRHSRHGPKRQTPPPNEIEGKPEPVKSGKRTGKSSHQDDSPHLAEPQQ